MVSRGKSHHVSPVNICSICGNIYSEHGNNAYPINMGRCCNRCNSEKVLPERIHRMHLRQGHGQKKDLRRYGS